MVGCQRFVGLQNHQQLLQRRSLPKNPLRIFKQNPKYQPVEALTNSSTGDSDGGVGRLDEPHRSTSETDKKYAIDNSNS